MSNQEEYTQLISKYKILYAELQSVVKRMREIESEIPVKSDGGKGNYKP